MEALHQSSLLYPLSNGPACLSSTGKAKHNSTQLATSKTGNPDVAAGEARTKPKQSKSRNGCVTCKGKRLKCDETKPTCQQCAKRGVECGGYKKDFKWRAYEETQLSSKSQKQSRKNTGGVTKAKKVPPPLSNAALNVSNASLSVLSASLSPFSPGFSSPLPSADTHQYPYEFLPHAEIPPSAKSDGFDLEDDRGYVLSHEGSLSASPPCHRYGHHSHASQSSVDTYIDLNELGPYSSANSSYNDISTSLAGNVPVTDMSLGNIYPTISVGTALYPIDDITIKQEEADDDDALYSLAPVDNQSSSWIDFPSPALSNVSSASSDSHDSRQTIARSVSMDPSDPSTIFMYFDRNTCGIMSLKNGPNENPWRTLIWPLAQETPALYHALSAMTAFHISRESPAYRVQGVEHVRLSLNALSTGIGNGTMSDEAALATTLTLAFSEAFDRHITTGREHLKGAKILINQALNKTQNEPQWADNFRRLRFLHNVWVYLDVLARLTSDTDDDTVPTPIISGPLASTEEVDPLMGCAGTLFPLIGRVANLVRKVRQCDSPTMDIISEGMELKSLLENWVPSAAFHEIEDTATSMVHCLKTAEAYQYATLLYLHQALPTLPSASSYQLAKKVLSLLASVPITSGTCVVHIYPLLAAGCEAKTPEERAWVKARWEQMSARMWIGNVDRAWEVVKEVWDRRDEAARQKSQFYFRGSPSLRPPFSHPASRSTSVARSLSAEDTVRPLTPEPEVFPLFDSFGIPFDPRMRPRGVSDSISMRPMIVQSSHGAVIDDYGVDIEEEITVKSNLHWAGVMRDWRWEVLLG